MLCAAGVIDSAGWVHYACCLLGYYAMNTAACMSSPQVRVDGRCLVLKAQHGTAQHNVTRSHLPTDVPHGGKGAALSNPECKAQRIEAGRTCMYNRQQQVCTAVVYLGATAPKVRTTGPQTPTAAAASIQQCVGVGVRSECGLCCVCLPFMKTQQVATRPQAAVMKGSHVRAPRRERMRFDGT
jgi:hypothetical protein